MTCIVGLVHKGTVYIGGDSAGVSSFNYGIRVRADKKVFRKDKFIFGFCGSFRLGQLLAHSLKPPRHHGDDEVYHYMVTEFVDAVRECLKKGGHATKENEEESIYGDFLVGYQGRLFCIHGDYQVGEALDGFYAVGCGDQIALGSLYSTPKLPPMERVKLALEASEAFSAGVRGPFHFETLEKD